MNANKKWLVKIFDHQSWLYVYQQTTFSTASSFYLATHQQSYSSHIQ